MIRILVMHNSFPKGSTYVLLLFGGICVQEYEFSGVTYCKL